jgi:hypothetical protein
MIGKRRADVTQGGTRALRASWLLCLGGGFCACGHDATQDRLPDSSIAVDDGGGPRTDSGAIDAILPADSGSDVGAEAGPTTDYHDMTDPSFWSTFDLSSIPGVSSALEFAGATFDGRYIYLVPQPTMGDCVALRYDTQASFSLSASWSTFDVTTGVDSSAKDFFGAAFDGRYVYFIPIVPTTIVRYDTLASFGDAPSWSSFDLAAVTTNTSGFAGAVFDDRYLYLAPNIGGVFLRYDTKAAFAAAASWSTFTESSGVGARGAIFDGSYVYFVPFDDGFAYDGLVSRFDTKAQGAFDASGSWSIFDTTTASATAAGFFGGAFDGRYLYLVPFSNTRVADGGATQVYANGLVTRYDTLAGFALPSSWSTFDTTTVNPELAGFQGAGFDGRYVYFVPYADATGYSGLVTRYDSTAPLGSASSWSVFDTSTLNPSAAGFFGSAFDSRYLYFLPGGGNSVMARFDTKIPPSMPPDYSGSFL